jgi:Carbohydrate binding domain
MFVSAKGKSLGIAGLLLAASALSGRADAGVVVAKPAPHGSGSFFAPEFSTSLSRAGSFTLVGALQEHVPVAGEATPTVPSIKQGAVYLMRGTNTSPERVYQFPGVAHFDLQAGSQVAISNRFLAFGTGGTSTSGQSSPFANSVFIARQVNGSWAQCPVVSSQPNCNGAVRENGQNLSRALTRIPLTYPAHFKSINLALSDDYLAIGYRNESVVEVYRYDAPSDRWVLELSLDEPNERFTGAALALDGDRLAVSSPWSDGSSVGAELGSVRIFKRNASNGTWAAAALTAGHFSSGAFGKTLAFSGNNLAVTSGASHYATPVPAQHLSFFRVAADGTLSARQSIQTAKPLVHLAFSGDALAATVYDSDEGLSLYKRDASSGVWAYETGLMRDFYKSANNGAVGYGGIDPIGFVGDDLSLGWRAFASLKGGVVHEKASLLDACRDPLNVVQNCSFDSVTNTALEGYQSSTGWQLLSWNGGAAWADYSGRQLRINVQQPGSDMWHVQARTTVKLAQAGNYRLTFRAKADAARSFVVNLGRNGNADNGWTSYGRVTAAAGPQWVIYSFDLPSVPQDQAAYLDFNVGNSGTAAVTLDSVKLVRLP